MTCTIDGCDEPMRAKGLCKAHYYADYHQRYKAARNKSGRERYRANRIPGRDVIGPIHPDDPDWTETPGLLAQCGDCGAVVGLVATGAGVWGALAAHRCEVVA